MTLPRSVVEELAEHLGPVREADAWVFTADKGGVPRPSNFRVKVWLPAIRAAGLAPLRPHDLRHTAVALWIAAGANPKESASGPGIPRWRSPWTATATCSPATMTSCATAWTPCTPRASRPSRSGRWWSCRAAQRGPSRPQRGPRQTTQRTNRCLKSAKQTGSGPAAQARNEPSTRSIPYPDCPLLTRADRCSVPPMCPTIVQSRSVALPMGSRTPVR